MSGTNHNHHHHSCGCKACSASQGSVFTSHEEPCCSHSHEHESDLEENIITVTAMTTAMEKKNRIING